MPNWAQRKHLTRGALGLTLGLVAVAMWAANPVCQRSRSQATDQVTDHPAPIIATTNPVIDFSRADFDSQNSFEIGRYLQPESVDGSAIYQATLKLPPNHHGFAIKFSEINGHALIYIDNLLVREAGYYDEAVHQTVAAGRHIYVPYYTENGTVNLKVKVTNRSAPITGITGTVKIGSPEAIAAIRTGGFVLDGVVASIMLFMFFYHLSIFAIERRRVSNLWFSLFSLFVLIRSTLVGEANLAAELFQIGDTWSWRAELITFYWSLPVLTAFMNALFPNETERRYPWITLALVIPFTLLTLLTEPRIFAPAKIFIQIAQVILTFVYLRSIMKAIARSRPGARAFLGGFLMLASLSLAEVAALYLGWDIPRLSNLGAVGFAAVQSILLAKGYSDAFYAAETSERNIRRLHNELVKQERDRLEITRIQTEKSMMKTSLAEAQAFTSALGDVALSMPELQVASAVKSAEVAGGDWLGIEYDEQTQRAYAVIADVTGHDMLSALVTLTAVGTFRGALAAIKAQETSDSPEAILVHLVRTMNDAVRKAGQKSERLMTMAVIMIDLRHGEAYYCNAGHTPLLMVSNQSVKAVARPSSPLGLASEVLPQVTKLDLNPGDGIFLYTDGLLDNEGPDGERLKIRMLQRLLAAAESPRECDRMIRESCENLWQNTPQKDDSSYLHIRWLPGRDHGISGAS